MILDRFNGDIYSSINTGGENLSIGLQGDDLIPNIDTET